MRVGDEVVWMRTEGGGGGSGRRPNPTQPRQVVIVALGPVRVRIRTLDLYERETWVGRAALRRRAPRGARFHARLDGRPTPAHLQPRAR